MYIHNLCSQAELPWWFKWWEILTVCLCPFGVSLVYLGMIEDSLEIWWLCCVVLCSMVLCCFYCVVLHFDCVVLCFCLCFIVLCCVLFVFYGVVVGCVVCCIVLCCVVLSCVFVFLLCVVLLFYCVLLCFIVLCCVGLCASWYGHCMLHLIPVSKLCSTTLATQIHVHCSWA